MTDDALRYWTWSEFNDKVIELLPQDSQRIGLEKYIPNLIRQAVLDLQDFVPGFRKRHETLYYPEDFAVDGAASVGALPPHADICEAWLWSMERNKRFTVENFKWQDRFKLVNQLEGDFAGNDFIVLTQASFASIEISNRLLAMTGVKRVALMAVDRAGHTFYFYPQIIKGWLLSLFWDGRKFDWKDDELVQFGEEEAWAVSAWVRAKIAMEVDRDQQRHDAIMRDYAVKRTNLFIFHKEKGKLKPN